MFVAPIERPFPSRRTAPVAAWIAARQHQAAWIAAWCCLALGCVTPSAGVGGYVYPDTTDLDGADGVPSDGWVGPADGSDSGNADLISTDGELSDSAEDGGPHDGGGGDNDGQPDTTTGPAACSATLGPAGGKLACGAVLDVPAGALAADTLLTLTDSQASAPAGFQGYSTLWRIDPPGVGFSKPATLVLPFQGASSLASAFWRSEGASIWTWLGGAAQNSKLQTLIPGGGEVFVANGIAYAQPADKNCAVLRKIEGRTQKPSNIAVFFTVDDCDGNPITDLQDGDFVLEEDGKPLSVESPAKVLPQKGLQVFLTLALDFSGSTDPMQDKVIGAAKALVQQIQIDQKLPAQISLEVFDGAEKSTVWQKHTLDTQQLLDRLDQLQGYKAKSSGTNLYGAVVDGLERLDVAQQVFRVINQGGAFTTGYLVVFTDGADTTGYLSAADALDAEAKSADQVLAVGLQTLDYDKLALQQLAPFGLLTAPDPTQLGLAFQAIGTRIAGQVSRTYLVAYCSVKKKDMHVLSIKLAAAKQNVPLQHTFDATGFVDGCTIASFETACKGKDCGGLGCGACDDRLAVCSGGLCRSFCDGWAVQVSPGSSPAVQVGQTGGTHCGLQSFANPLGYQQTCADAPKRTWCVGGCIDTTTANFNAAGCGECSAAFAGPKCDQCAKAQFAPPDCKSTCAAAFQGPGCSQCKDPHFAPPDCKTTCAPEFAGPGCNQCAAPKFALPDCKTTCANAFTGPGCGQCKYAQFSPPDCKTTCAPEFTGPGCTQCADVQFAPPDCTKTCAKAFTGTSCTKCTDPHFALPDCTSTCAKEFDGMGCAKCADPVHFSLPDCKTCTPQFVGNDCSQCAQPQFAGPDCTPPCTVGITGPNCSACVDPQKGMPTCLCAKNETGIAVSASGSSGLVCAPDYPAWGIRPLNPKALFSVNEGTVLDAGTQLVWQRDSSKGLDWLAARTYCDTLQLGAYTDWRLPTMFEVETLIDYTKTGAPPMPDQFLWPSEKNQWTESRVAPGWSKVWTLQSHVGKLQDAVAATTAGISARCVRGVYKPAKAIPSPRFVVDASKGKVVDMLTWLTWQRTVPTDPMTWENAKKYCETAFIAGEWNWRLPTVLELRSLVDPKRSSPAIDTEAFPMSANASWSSTAGFTASTVRIVDYTFGTAEDKKPAWVSHVRCVR